MNIWKTAKFVHYKLLSGKYSKNDTLSSLGNGIIKVHLKLMNFYFLLFCITILILNVAISLTRICFFFLE